MIPSMAASDGVSSEENGMKCPLQCLPSFWPSGMYLGSKAFLNFSEVQQTQNV